MLHTHSYTNIAKIGTALALAVFLTACTNNAPAADTNTQDAQTRPALEQSDQTSMLAEDSTGSGESMAGQEQVFIVEGDNYKFNTPEMRVKQGDKVKVTFTSKTGMHDWVLDEFNAKTKVLQAGQSETVEFTADKAGTFEYYCSVGSHRQMGMVGKLIVE